MGKVALIVEYTTKEGCLEAFLDLIAPHAAASREEPGTLRFDVLLPQEEANKVVLYELYADQDAYRFHASSERLAALRKAVPELVTGRKGALCDMKDDGGL